MSSVLRSRHRPEARAAAPTGPVSASPAERLFAPVDASALVAFRILFGLLLLYEAVSVWRVHEVRFPVWEFRPTWPLLAFMEDWPRGDAGPWLLAMAAACVGIVLGLLTRLSALAFTACYGAVYMLDPTRFNNHEYLICLLGFWLAVLRTQQHISIDALFRPALCGPDVPRWHLLVLQAHFGMVYVFGGLAKLNGDWLRGEPMRAWLAVEADTPVIGPLLAQPWMGLLFAWGGLVFDLLIVPLLLHRRSRPSAIAATFVFHLTNSWLFEIGVFPFLMLAANVLFLEPDTPRRLVDRLAGRWRRSPYAASTPLAAHESPPPPSRGRRMVVALLGGYFLVHALLPFRHLIYASHVEWTEEGKYFSWRMMLSHKETFVGILVIDRATGEVWEVDQRTHLTQRQRRGKGVWGNPRHLAAYARFLRREALRRGMRQPYVRVDAVASLNGRPYQYLVDPDIDLAAAEQPWLRTPSWIVPLRAHLPIGDYPASLQEQYDRVMAVIWKHRQSQSQRAARL